MIRRATHSLPLVFILALIAGITPSVQGDTGEQAAQPHCAILLHGLIRTPRSMSKLERALDEDGYQVVNLGYPSREAPIEELALIAIPPALNRCESGSRIHFVTHSLGGILLRQYLTEAEILNLGRSVMLAPPNQGSHIPDEMGDWIGFDLFNGPAGAQLGTGEDSLPAHLPPVTFELGVIAGDKSINPLLSDRIPGEDDGKVAVDYTKVEGMSGHITLPVSHTYMMNNDEVITQTLYYLRNGVFLDDSLPPDVVFTTGD
ncbi:esterase/lipase family protein [Robiginitomaculum antarcticum]|uniref:esterase/lipase family protein n=1 Tax=Robiginitomaculum antarcticum TaxID=437507 RepID=UPI00037900D6|nr:alpha/beta hydrolase [Robiginitomaculum antarcticum]